MRPCSAAICNLPRSRLVALENTHNRGGGRIWPRAQMHGRARGPARTGWRCTSTARGSGTPPSRAASRRARPRPRPSTPCRACFSKGLGAPVGSALAGAAEAIEAARRFRKMLGGGMRQAGILAAAGLYALDHHRARLAEDHANARRLAEGLAAHAGDRVDPARVETNIVIFGVTGRGWTRRRWPRGSPPPACAIAPISATRLRAVTHLDVDAAGIDRALAAVRAAATAESVVRAAAPEPLKLFALAPVRRADRGEGTGGMRAERRGATLAPGAERGDGGRAALAGA